MTCCSKSCRGSLPSLWEQASSLWSRRPAAVSASESAWLRLPRQMAKSAPSKRQPSPLTWPYLRWLPLFPCLSNPHLHSKLRCFPSADAIEYEPPQIRCPYVHATPFQRLSNHSPVPKPVTQIPFPLMSKLFPFPGQVGDYACKYAEKCTLSFLVTRLQ
jgi:hypothetical protein